MDKVEDLPGVGAATAEKLISAGYDTFLSIAVTSPGEMVNIAGVTEATARKIINAARSKLGAVQRKMYLTIDRPQ